ncbi:MAG: hypothetical protein ABII02_04690 [Candidatus Magasanikbacteria bacterium]
MQIKKKEGREKSEIEKTKEVFKTKKKLNIGEPGRVTFLEFSEKTEDDQSPEEILKNAKLVAIGDAHGSALKVLENAVLSEMITMPEEKARQFKKIYTEMAQLADPITFKTQSTPFETEERLIGFKEKQKEALELLDSIEWIGGDREMVFLGDLISDRGLSDLLTMKILKKIKADGGNIVTLAGNHDMQPVLTIAKHQKKPLSRYKGIGDGQKVSSGRSLATEHKTTNIQMKGFYIRQKLFHYDEETKSLFTHAPLSQGHIDELKQAISFQGDITNPKTMAAFVDRVNEWHHDTLKSIYEDKTPDENNLHLINTLVWARERLKEEKDYPLPNVVRNYVHGHDTTTMRGCPASIMDLDRQRKKYDPDGFNLFNLDNVSRKADSDPTEEVLDSNHTFDQERFFVIPNRS